MVNTASVEDLSGEFPQVVTYLAGVATPLVLAGLVALYGHVEWWVRHQDWVTRIRWTNYPDREFQRVTWGKRREYVAVTFHRWPHAALCLRIAPWRRRRPADIGRKEHQGLDDV